MLLLINACAREESRTLPLALKKAEETNSGEILTVNLYDAPPAPLDASALIKRDAFVAAGDYSDDMFAYARQFREADEIIIAAPYWDLSFPAILKCYVENICVNGLTFRYTEDGRPEGLCKAKKLTYVTTAGGFIPERDFGYSYIKELCSQLFGIGETECIKREGLDIR